MVQVDEPEPVTLDGLNVMVAPAGTPLALQLTVPPKPPIAEAVVVPEAMPPAATVCEPGVAATEKSAAELTVRLIVVLWVRVSPTIVLSTPVIVTVTVPVAAVLLAVKVNVLVPVVGLGLNDAVTPLGNPEADRSTLPA